MLRRRHSRQPALAESTANVSRGTTLRPDAFDALARDSSDALARCDVISWAVPSELPGLPRLAVRHRDWETARTALDRMDGISAAPIELPQTARGQASSSPVLRLARAPHESGAAREVSVDVEPWAELEADRLEAPTATAFGRRFRLPDASPTATLQIPGHRYRLPTYELFTRTPLGRATFPIDVVYTWVDDSDPAWRKQRAATDSTGASAEDIAAARFRNRDELRYSLRSIAEFAPWVRQVFVVTAGQRPEWLDDETPGLRVVDHREILKAEYLPTFNSHAIESGLHRVEGLAEHYLYVNDDVFFLEDAWPEDYFEGNGLLRFFPSRHHFAPLSDEPRGYQAAARRGHKFIESEFAVTTSRYLRHTPHPQRVSVLQEFETKYPRVFEETGRAQFRGQGDYNIASSLGQSYAYATGRAVPGSMPAILVNVTVSNARAQLDRAIQRRVKTLCLNDHQEGDLTPEESAAVVADFLERRFPVPSSVERGPAG